MEIDNSEYTMWLNRPHDEVVKKLLYMINLINNKDTELLNEFAGRAMQGLLYDPDCMNMLENEVAEMAYKQAEAMLIESKKHIKG